MRQFKVLGVAMATALMVAACGGGGGDGNQAPRVAIASVKVMGDSLVDSGTFLNFDGNRIFGIQGSDSKNFAELTAASYGISSLCNVYTATGETTFSNTKNAGCTNYGVGRSRVNPGADLGGTTSPFSIIKQLSDAGASTSYQASDLLIIDGGGNDAADLVGLYLAFGSAKGVYDATHLAAPGTQLEANAYAALVTANTAYATLLTSVLAPASVMATLNTGAAGYASVGGDYMKALADKFYDAIKTNALDKNAKHVAIMNIPGVLKTPRFQLVLGSVAQATANGYLAQGASASTAADAGTAARAQFDALASSWVEAFNNQLKLRATGDSRVVVVDIYSNFNDYIAHPADYGLTNVTMAACPITGQDSVTGLPTYTFATCTQAALSASPPTGVAGGADWWKTYAFADNFHPSPAVYKLASQLLNRSLIQAGWL